MADSPQRIVIIGGTSGIGLGAAELLARRGDEVVLGSSRADKLADARERLSGSVIGSVIDVTDDASVTAFAAWVGPFDHLVYTAGAPLNLMPVTDIDLDTATRYFDIRCFGILRTINHLAKHIRPGGSITLTSGPAGARPSAGWTVAAGTAGTIDAFTRALAVELAPLRVNAVSPGTVRTPLWDGLADDERQAYYNQTAATNLTRTISTPEEIAPAYAFLIDQPFATGTILSVEGGRLLV